MIKRKRRERERGSEVRNRWIIYIRRGKQEKERDKRINRDE